MSNATKCDRCGAVYKGTEGIVILPSHDDDFDLCADCMADLAEWMDYQPVTDVPERVTKTPEMSYDTREQLESYVTLYLTDKVCTWGKQRYELRNEVIRWLDRQAAITSREHERNCAACVKRLDREDLEEELEDAHAANDLLNSINDDMRAEIATLKKHRAGNMERLHDLTDANAEMAWRIQELEKEIKTMKNAQPPVTSQ